MSVNWVSCSTCYTKTEGPELVVLDCSVPVIFFEWRRKGGGGGGVGGGCCRPLEGSPRRYASNGPLAHTFNYFVMSCPVLRSFSFLSFGNKFSSKITKHTLEWDSLVSSLNGLCHSKWYNDLGCRDGAMVRALSSHQFGSGSIPRLCVICELSLLVLYSAPRGFSPGTLVSSSLEHLT